MLTLPSINSNFLFLHSLKSLKNERIIHIISLFWWVITTFSLLANTALPVQLKDPFITRLLFSFYILQLIWLSRKCQILKGDLCWWVFVNYCLSLFSVLPCFNLHLFLKIKFSTNRPLNSLFATYVQLF